MLKITSGIIGMPKKKHTQSLLTITWNKGNKLLAGLEILIQELN